MSSSEWLVCLFSGFEYANVHVESFVVCTVGKMACTRCRNGVKVLFPSCLAALLSVPSLCALVFVQKAFL